MLVDKGLELELPNTTMACMIRAVRRAKLPTIFLLGGPGSGKRTLAHKLKLTRDYTYIDIGLLLRERKRSQKFEKRRLVEDFIASAELAPEDLVYRMLMEAMFVSKGRCRPYLVQGFPADIHQFARFQCDVGGAELAVHLAACDEELVRRVRVRLVRGAREDDTELNFRKRLHIFRDRTEPLIEHLSSLGNPSGKLITMDAQQNPRKTFLLVGGLLDENDTIKPPVFRPLKSLARKPQPPPRKEDLR